MADLNLLHARDITFAMASPAPQPNLRAYAERMGWTDLPWYTIKSDSFAEDVGAQEWFALNVFLRDGEEIYRTYFLQTGTMVGHIGSVNSLAALTPFGGQVEGEDVPDGWPQESVSYWMRRHDEFDEPALVNAQLNIASPSANSPSDPRGRPRTETLALTVRRPA